MMDNSLIAAALPVGEFDGGPVESQFDAMLAVVRRLGAQPVTADPVAGEEAARRSVETLSVQHPDLLLIVPLRGLSAQAIEAAARLSRVPVLVCPVQGGFALPSSALAVGALRPAQAPVELLYAPVDHAEFATRLGWALRSARAWSRLRAGRIGVVGGLFPNLVSCRYDAGALHARLGTGLLPIPFERLRRMIQATPPALLEQAGAALTAPFDLPAADREAIPAGVGLHLALKQIAADENLDGFAAECWSAFPRELGLNPCLGFLEDAYTLACEGDVLLCVALLAARALAGASAYAGDLYDLDMDGVMTLTHCGAPASLASDQSRVVVGRSQLAQARGFETLTCRPALPPGPVTVFRFYGPGCDELHLASGELLASEHSPSLGARIRLAGDRWAFLERCLGNHYVAAAGDLRPELRLLSRWLGIAIFET